MKDLQRINVKILTPSSTEEDLTPFLDIFTQWKDASEEWLDVADYLHMVDGPGVVLFGTNQIASVHTTGGLGFSYSNRSGLTGEWQERFQNVLKRTLELNSELLAHSKYPSQWSKELDTLEISINDRMFQNAGSEMESAVTGALQSTFGESAFEINKSTTNTGLLSFNIKLSKSL